MSYNGWTNRETWLISLWGYLDNIEDDIEDLSVFEIESYIKNSILQGIQWEFQEVFENGVIYDLFMGAFDRIDTLELARSLYDDLENE